MWYKGSVVPLMRRLESKAELHAKIKGMLWKSDKDMHAADWLDLHYQMLDMKNFLESVLQRAMTK